MDNAPLGQQYHERVEALKAQGIKQADAIRQVAKELGKQEGAIRGGIHNYKSRHPADGPVASGAASFDSYLDKIRSVLSDAKESLDADVQRAKEALDAAQAVYDEAVKVRDERLPEIEEKFKALG